MFKKPLSASGFTLVELIITLTIAGILTAIAVPTFNSVISNNRLTAYSNEFVTALNLARSEAIKRGTQITIKRNGPTTKEWQYGWDVFVDIAGQPSGNNLWEFKEDDDEMPCEVDASGAAIEDCLLRTYSKLPNTFTLKSNGNIADVVGFKAMGRSISKTGLGNGTLILCDTNRHDDPDPLKSDQLKAAKLIIISPTGRVRMGVDSDNDGIPNRDSGLDIESCSPV
jgi:type IV fimbrial biogenesis protein FimT